MSARNGPIAGALAGATLCAVARFLVAAGFISYVSHSGGSWWQGIHHFSSAASISAGIGIIVGSIAGCTCKPFLGALIGAGFSGGTCFGLFVVPTELMIGMSHPGGVDRIETVEVLFGFVAMILVGGISGGIGAAIGQSMETVDEESE